MVFSQLLGLLALGSLAIGSPVAAPAAQADDIVTVTVTATTTAVVTASTSAAPVSSFTPTAPPPPLSDLTVWRTRTVTRWRGTTTVASQLNCTRTVLAGGANPPPRTSATRAPPVVPTLLPFRRQANASSTAVSLISATVALPTMAPGEPRPRPRRTRTSYTTITVTPTSDLRRTRLECAKTVTYLYTIDRTTTQTFTITSWPNVVTSTSLIACFPGGGGGRPGLPTTGRQPTTRLPLPTARPPPPPPLPTPSSVVGASKRQIGTGTASLVPIPIITPTPSAVLPPPAVLNNTITVHVTSTIFNFVTTINPNTTTVLAYGCSPVSTPVAISTTVSASMVMPSPTGVSSPPPPPPVPVSPTPLPPPPGPSVTVPWPSQPTAVQPTLLVPTGSVTTTLSISIPTEAATTK